MIEAGIFSLLTNTSAITAICGTRVYPDVQPKEPTWPNITYSVVSTTQDPTFTTRGMQRLRVEFICEATTALQATTLRNAIDAALNGYQGALADGTFIQNCDRINAMSSFDEEAQLYRRMIEFYFYFT